MSEMTILTGSTTAGRNAGRLRRDELPRKSLGVIGDRPAGFDPVALLEAQATDRVPDLVPLRYQRMAANEFSFLRGAAAIMAYDSALTPSTGIEVQLCGDAHIANFGVFLSPERSLTFDVNDFDETLPGPFEWDVKRLVASAATALSFQNFSEKMVIATVLGAAESYRTAMLALEKMGNLDVWYQRLDIESNLVQLREIFTDKGRSPVDEIVAKARRSTSRRAFSKLTSFENGRLAFMADPPVVVPVADLLDGSYGEWTSPEVIKLAVDGYAGSLASDRAHLLSTYEAVDMARKVVGVGSVGTRCFIILMLGRGIEDPLIIQMKEAMPSVLENHLGPTHHDSAGARVVAGQRLMQTTPDIFLGHFRASYSETESHDFYFRQFHDGKASPDLENIQNPKVAKPYLDLCAWTLARAHARSGDRSAIAAYLGNGAAFDKAMVDFALGYVERNRADYATFLEAIESGRLPSMPATAPTA